MYLRKLREAQNFLSEKYVSKIPMFKQTKFFHSFWSSWQSAKSLDTFEGLNIGTVPHICFLRYRKYDFSIRWLCPHSKIAPDMRIHKVSPCSLLLELFFFFSAQKSFALWMNALWTEFSHWFLSGIITSILAVIPGAVLDDIAVHAFSISLSFCSHSYFNNFNGNDCNH